jgi:two-component system alkaline phosphatase synthesis response regulator PhoP
MVKGSILIVDDNEEIAMIFQKFLSNAGYQVEAETTASGAMERMEGSSFDLAIMDFMIEGTRGDELALEFRKRNNSMQLIFVTGYTDIYQGDNRPEGVHEVLVKPVSLEDLLTSVQEALSQRGGNASPGLTI